MEKYVTKEKYKKLVDKHNELCMLLQSMELNKLADFTDLIIDDEDDEDDEEEDSEDSEDGTNDEF